jgi:hypothetical protein
MRKVALIGEACAGCDFCQSISPVANKLERTLQSKVHDVTVRRDTNGSREYARKMGRTVPHDACELANPHRLIEMGNDIVPDPLEVIRSQRLQSSQFS